MKKRIVLLLTTSVVAAVMLVAGVAAPAFAKKGADDLAPQVQAPQIEKPG